jgi:hypothetical protein
MILTGEYQSTQRNTCPIGTLFAANLTCTGQGLNTRFCSGRLATNGWSHGMTQDYTNWDMKILKASHQGLAFSNICEKF